MILEMPPIELIEYERDEIYQRLQEYRTAKHHGVEKEGKLETTVTWQKG